MSKICQRHIVKPVKIYSQCVGCELEWLQADVKQLRIEIRSLKKEKYQLVMQKAERDEEIAELKEENERLQREIKRYAELEKALRERGCRNGRREKTNDLRRRLRR